MTLPRPYYSDTDGAVTLYQGDALAVLAALPSESVHCMVTSPPYWSLRDYGVAGQLGLEPTPELFIEKLVAIFREARRVLRDDGVCWVNLGDSYAGTGKSGGGVQGEKRAGAGAEASTGKGTWQSPPAGLKVGDLVGIPWMFAFAARADGWYLRGDVCWHKPNPMPESVSGWSWQRCRVKVAGGAVARHGFAGSGRDKHGATISARDGAKWEPCPGCPKCETADGLVLRRGSWRPTRAHEFIFQLAKSPDYFCDAQAVAEPTSGSAHDRGGGVHPKTSAAGSGVRANGSYEAAITKLVAERNPRSVWTIQSEPFSASSLGVEDVDHFATFPSALPERCIRASTSEAGVCGACGAPVARVLGEKQSVGGAGAGNSQRVLAGGANGRQETHLGSGVPWKPTTTTTTGWRPTCECDAAVVPATVLDPFNGAGTTGLVAAKLGRRYVGIELCAEYLDLTAKRIAAGLNPLAPTRRASRGVRD